MTPCHEGTPSHLILLPIKFWYPCHDVALDLVCPHVGWEYNARTRDIVTCGEDGAHGWWLVLIFAHLFFLSDCSPYPSLLTAVPVNVVN